MLRLLFEKKRNAVWISHLDLMRVFQRAFKRAGLPLTHTQGFNPRPSVSIALPLSVGVESQCELLDFELDGVDVSCEEVCQRLNSALIEGVCVLKVYSNGMKIKELACLQCAVRLEYDRPVPIDACQQIRELFSRGELLVPKKSKNGIQDQDIIPLIKSIDVRQPAEHFIELQAMVCCQNPSLNPAQLAAAIGKYLPKLSADHVTCCRQEIYDRQNSIFR